MLDFYGYGVAHMWTTSINKIQYVAYIKHLTNYATVNMHILSFMHLNLSAHWVHLYSVYVFTLNATSHGVMFTQSKVKSSGWRFLQLQ